MVRRKTSPEDWQEQTEQLAANLFSLQEDTL